MGLASLSITWLSPSSFHHRPRIDGAVGLSFSIALGHFLHWSSVMCTFIVSCTKPLGLDGGLCGMPRLVSVDTQKKEALLCILAMYEDKVADSLFSLTAVH
jgi:hypothetical protein